MVRVDIERKLERILEEERLKLVGVSGGSYEDYEDEVFLCPEDVDVEKILVRVGRRERFAVTAVSEAERRLRQAGCVGLKGVAGKIERSQWYDYYYDWEEDRLVLTKREKGGRRKVLLL